MRERRARGRVAQRSALCVALRNELSSCHANEPFERVIQFSWQVCSLPVTTSALGGSA